MVADELKFSAYMLRSSFMMMEAWIFWIFLMDLMDLIAAQIPTIPPDSRIQTPSGLRSYCYNVIDYQIACQSLTSSWTALAPIDQASCYCYDNSGRYVPSVYDDAASKCYEFVSATPIAGDLTYILTKNVGACTRFASALSVTQWSSFETDFAAISSSPVVTTRSTSSSSKESTTMPTMTKTSAGHHSVALNAMPLIYGAFTGLYWFVM